MNLRQYFKNVSLLFIINFSIKPIWVFGVEQKFQPILGNGVYGKYFSSLGLIYILSVLLDMGLHNYTVKKISETKHQAKSQLAELWFSKACLMALYLFAVMGAIWIQGLNQEESIHFFSIALEMLIFSLYQYLRCFIQGFQLLKQDSFLSSLDRILLILLGISILSLYKIGFSISLMLFIWMHILAYALSFLLVWIRYHSILSFRRDQLKSVEFFEIIREGWPLIIISLLMTLYTRLDAVILEKIIPDGAIQSGYLANSYRFIDSAYNVLALLSVFLLPTIASKSKTNQQTYIKKIVWISFAFSTILSLGFILFAGLFGDYIYLHYYKSALLHTSPIFKTQAWSVLGVGWMYVFGSYLTATGRFQTLIGIVLLGVILSIGLNLSLIPKQKAYGVACSSSIIQMTMGLLHLIFGAYYLHKSNEHESRH